MKVLNQTKQTVLAEKIIIPNTLTDKSFGLLKYKTPAAMLLKTRFGIHTFGMKYPIDVLILNKQNHVVAMKEKLKTNRIFVWNMKYETVLELPYGAIKKSITHIGDILQFTNAT